MAKEYKEQGLKVLLFPCNQFAAEEPGSHQEILRFVKENYDADADATFSWFAKRDVNGANARELYDLLKKELPDEKTGSTEISWNFGKFLIAHDGEPIRRYGPDVAPFATRKDVERLLRARNMTTTTTNDDGNSADKSNAAAADK